MKKWTKTLQFASDLGAVNRQYFRSSSFRRATMQLLALPSDPLELSGASLREYEVAPHNAKPYAGLSGAALALSCLGPHGTDRPTVTLVLSELDPFRVFAGVHTAIAAAGKLAHHLNMSLRVLVLSETATPRDRIGLAEAVTLRLGDSFVGRVTLAFRSEISSLGRHEEDVWLVTHWTTAHSALVAVRSRVINPARVVYLVQDYEPDFVAASVDSLTAQSTYHEGFPLLVNSTPVATVLRQREGIDIDEERVFSPQIDAGSGEDSAVEADASATPTVFFYGRPSKPRNLFMLGVASLRVAAASVETKVNWVSAGESHADVDLGGGHTLRSVGTLDWSAYFNLLSRSRVALSLQATPHPSHPPLEAAARGVPTVTNDVDGARSNLHPMILTATADPQSLGTAILAALEMSPHSRDRGMEAPELGVPLESAVASVARDLAAAHRN